MKRQGAGLILLFLGVAGNVRAEDRPQPKVRAGNTTVTVIDEGESVDEVISRVREAGEKNSIKESGKVLPVAVTEKDRAQIQEKREEKRADKNEIRRAQKQQLRQEKLRERKLERRRQDGQGTRRKRG